MSSASGWPQITIYKKNKRLLHRTEQQTCEQKKLYEPPNEQMRKEWHRRRKGQDCVYSAVMRWAGVMWSGLPLAGPPACYSSYSDDFSAAGELWWPWHMFTAHTIVREQEETLGKWPDRENFIQQHHSSWYVTDPNTNGPHSEDWWAGYQSYCMYLYTRSSKGHTDIPKKA